MSNAGRKLQRWTRLELNSLHQLYNAGLSLQDIALELRTTEPRVKQRLQWEARATDDFVVRRKRRIERANRIISEPANSPRSPRVHLERVTPGAKPTDLALAIRNQRLQTSHRDLTAAFFGDPLPGYSALDQKQGHSL